VTINDDEPMVSIVSSTPQIIEGGPQPGVLTVLRSGNPDYEFTARLAVGGSAAYGVDYPPFLTNVFFSCGITSIDLLISATNELVVEPTESVTAALVPNPAYTILARSARHHRRRHQPRAVHQTDQSQGEYRLPAPHQRESDP
jgi:hypothetical protein